MNRRRLERVEDIFIVMHRLFWLAAYVIAAAVLVWVFLPLTMKAIEKSTPWWQAQEWWLW